MIYPETTTQQPGKLLAMLGSFWSSLYGGKDLLEKILAGRGELEQQNWADFMEAMDARTRQKVPVFHTENWTLLTLKESKKKIIEGEFTWDIDATLEGAEMACNRIEKPSLVLFNGLDFRIDVDEDRIVFLKDPFDNTLWSSKPLFDGSESDDSEVYVWLFKSKVDEKHIHEYWGFILGLELASSENYRDFLNVLLDAVTCGTAIEQIASAYSLLVGVPLVKTDEETVEAVISDAVSDNIVITDANVYRLPDDVTVTVDPDDELKRGDPVCDGLLIDSLNRGEIPSGLTSISLGQKFLTETFGSSLTFSDETVPLEVSTDDGVTRVEFKIGGSAADKQKFWDTVHDRGVAEGETLADLLRVNPGGKSEASNLPATINPLQFLIENVLRCNAVVVQINTTNVPEAFEDFDSDAFLRKITPPGMAVIEA